MKTTTASELSTTTTAHITTNTTTSTISTTSMAEDFSNLKLNGKEIKEETIFNGIQDVLAAVRKGDKYKFIKVETLIDGQIRLFIEASDGRRWKRGKSDMVELTQDRGTIWRLTPHPIKPGKFQLHYDENNWYDQDPNIRRAITSNRFLEQGVSVLEVARISFSESIFMNDEEFLWTFE